MAASTTIFESDIEGTRATASAHRKIELQSPADLTYLIANVSRAARSKIDTHLPPDAAPESGEDALRRRVEVLVEEYIRKTFEGAKEGISVNGMGVGEMEEVLKRVGEGEEIEPFDAKLAQRVQALSAQIENQTLQLASLRRDAPGATARRFEEDFKRRSEEDEARVRKQEEMDAEAARAMKLDVGDVERLGEVQGTWQRGTEQLEDLKGKVGGTVARMERAKRAVEFVEGRD
ncbi:hypothetical protein Q7P36_003965 [Cladosporium allicinum]